MAGERGPKRTRPEGRQRPSADERKYQILHYIIERERAGEPATVGGIKRDLGIGSRNTVQGDINAIISETSMLAQSRKGGLPKFRAARLIADPRNIDRLEEKMTLAQDASRWLRVRAKDNFQLFLDGGTTCRLLYELLAEQPPAAMLVTVYTNDVCTATVAGSALRLETVLVPGPITRNFTVVGREAEEFLTRRNFHLAVLSCSDIHLFGVEGAGQVLLVSTAAREEVGLKMAAVRRSKCVMLLADYSKLRFDPQVNIQDPKFGLSGLSEAALRDPNELKKTLGRWQPYSPFAWAFRGNGESFFRAFNDDSGSGDGPDSFYIFTNHEAGDGERIGAFQEFAPPGEEQVPATLRGAYG